MDQTIFCAPKRQAVGSNPAGRATKIGCPFMDIRFYLSAPYVRKSYQKEKQSLLPPMKEAGFVC